MPKVETRDEDIQMHSSALKGGPADEWNAHHVRHPKQLNWKTAKQLAAETPPEPPWIVKPWVVRGALTEISAKPKVGKTTFYLHLIKAVTSGDKFMGEQPVQCPVVYLTEEPSPSFAEAIRKAGLEEEANLHILLWQDTLAYKWPDLVEQAVIKCLEMGAQMLVIDTVPMFAGLQGDDENKAGAALKAIEPLRIAAAYNIAVVLVRHDRKADGQVGDTGRGTNAWAGAVDIVMSYRWGPNIESSYREIHALSRYSATSGKTHVVLKEGIFERCLGPDIAQDDAEEKIFAIAPLAEHDAMSAHALIKQAKTFKTTGNTAIKKLVEDGKLQSIGKGAKGSPKLYYKGSS